MMGWKEVCVWGSSAACEHQHKKNKEMLLESSETEGAGTGVVGTVAQRVMTLMVIGSDAAAGSVGSSVVARGRVSVVIEDK